jgi:hypothetical protein
MGKPKHDVWRRKEQDHKMQIASGQISPSNISIAKKSTFRVSDLRWLDQWYRINSKEFQKNETYIFKVRLIRSIPFEEIVERLEKAFGDI